MKKVMISPMKLLWQDPDYRDKMWKMRSNPEYHQKMLAGSDSRFRALRMQKQAKLRKQLALAESTYKKTKLNVEFKNIQKIKWQLDKLRTQLARKEYYESAITHRQAKR